MKTVLESYTPKMDIYEFLGGQNSEETLRAYQTDLSQYINITGGVLDRKSVILFRDTLLKEGKSPSTVARKMSSVRSYCDFLRGQGSLTIDPFAGVRAPKVSVSEPTQAFTDAEVKKLFDIKKSNRDQLVLGLLFFAGLRRQEAAALTVGDIAERDGVLVLKVFGKGGKFREIPAHPKLQAMLVPFLGTPSFKITATTSLLNISTGTIYAIIKKYAKLAGIKKNVSPHSCRATAISQLLENGYSPRDVADFAGHSNVNTTIGSYDKKRDGIKNSSAFKLKF
jgi:site-specific recombinase XerD